MHITDKFIDDTFERYHYSLDQRELFEKVAWSVRSSIKDSESAELVFGEECVDVAFTLGARLDTVIANYSKAGKLLEELMAMNLASALLMEGYKEFAEDARTYFKSKGIIYKFWGSQELPMDTLKEEMDKFESIAISFTNEISLSPSQSVVYRMVPGCAEKSSICSSCEKGLSGRCELNQQ